MDHLHHVRRVGQPVPGQADLEEAVGDGAQAFAAHGLPDAVEAAVRHEERHVHVRQPRVVLQVAHLLRVAAEHVQERDHAVREAVVALLAEVEGLHHAVAAQAPVAEGEVIQLRARQAQRVGGAPAELDLGVVVAGHGLGDDGPDQREAVVDVPVDAPDDVQVHRGDAARVHVGQQRPPASRLRPDHLYACGAAPSC
eukprot:166179-Hanusia_phi.AAC.6